jgi:hypothetical protein
MYRHVLGWYRVIKELNDCGVTTICVFDGKERSLAKAREVSKFQQISVKFKLIVKDRLSVGKRFRG